MLLPSVPPIPAVVPLSILGTASRASALPHLHRQSPLRPGPRSWATSSQLAFHITADSNWSLLTLSRSAPASMSVAAASPCPDSMARCSGVLPRQTVSYMTELKEDAADAPARSWPLSLVLGLPSGGFRSNCKKAFDPVVAARCKGNWFALSFAFI
jgi:hypothetical protein